MCSVHAMCVVESGESGVLGVFCSSQFAILVDGSYTRRPQCAAFLAHAGCSLVVPARTPPLGSLLLPAPRPSAHPAAPDLALLWRCIRQLQTRITHNTHSRRPGRPIPFAPPHAPHDAGNGGGGGGGGGAENLSARKHLPSALFPFTPPPRASFRSSRPSPRARRSLALRPSPRAGGWGAHHERARGRTPSAKRAVGRRG